MKKNVKILIALVVMMLIGFGAIIGISGTRRGGTKFSVVATNFPAYDFARAVAGDVADIKMLVRPGVEVHDYEPTPSDIVDIKNSDLFVYTGGESDEWIEGILDDMDATDSNGVANRANGASEADEINDMGGANDTDGTSKGKTKLFRMMDAVNVVEEELVDGMEEHNDDDNDADASNGEHASEHHEEEIEYDEHVWTSIRNAVRIVSALKDELIEIAPENAQTFTKNAQEYIEKLENLDVKFQEIVERGNRKTIIFGDRFPLRYFVDDYGLDYFAAFSGCSDQTEASSKTVAFLVEKVKSENIPVVFRIEMSSGNIAKTIADETSAKVLTFNSAHNISAEDFENGRTYAEIMEDNLTVLEEALE